MAANGTSDGSYSEQAEYDKNGNITRLTRNGNQDALYLTTQIDDLQYTYDAGGGHLSNRLNRVYDASNSNLGFKDDVHSAPDTDDDYTYDGSGNVTADQNKGILSISYNHLNQPVEIIFAGTNKKIIYIYTAGGDKVQKMVQRTATAFNVTDYLDGFQYKNEGLLFFPTGEGYVSNTIAGGSNHYNYVFNYLDHLGNVRLSFGLNEVGVLKIFGENHYYPYGLKHTGYNTDAKEFGKNEGSEGVLLKEAPIGQDGVDEIYRYKFNGMEWQDEMGLNLYDMDMRDYDPGVGRWMGMDPVIHDGQSPYMAFNGNPVYYADPSGADGVGGEVWSQSFGSYSSTPYNGAGANFSGQYGGLILPNSFATNVGAAWGDGGLLPHDPNGTEEIFRASDIAAICNSFNSFKKQSGFDSNGIEVGPLEAFPSFSTLEANYPGDSYTSPQVYELIGGKVYQNYLSNPETYANSCALRMSYALNKSGVNIPYTKGETGSGKDGKWYFYRVNAMSKFLNEKYGKPDVNGKTRNDFKGMKGIIQFDVSGWDDATGHFTIWNGSNVGHGDYFNRAYGIHLWIFN